jgi:protoheme IX farnesyltransferase
MVPLGTLIFGALGIWLVAGSAAAVNCLVERKIDAMMARTRARPLPMGTITAQETLAFAGVVGGAGLLVLYLLVNPLTMWLTAATFVGYAIIYTVLLKPLTPQNSVIGGGVSRSAAAVPDHLRLDPAAFLVARAVPQERVR